MRLTQKIDCEVRTYQQQITLPNGKTHDHYDIIKRINLHKSGNFYDCDDPDAIFWPLGKPRAPYRAAKLDFNTRNFPLMGKGDYHSYQAWAMNHFFTDWSIQSGFALDLDDLGDTLTDFGSAIMKIQKVNKGKYGGWDFEEVSLNKIFFDPRVKYLKGQTKIELHEFTEEEVMEMKWKNKEESWKHAVLIDEADNEGSEESSTVKDIEPTKKYWERVGWFDTKQYDKNGKYHELTSEEKKTSKTRGAKFMRYVVAGLADKEVIVFDEEIKEHEDPYVDFHTEKYENTWLRLGPYQESFGIQKLANETVNYNRATQAISSLLLFKTKNKALKGSNILRQAESGLITDADIEQIGITNQAFGEFINTLAVIEEKADGVWLTPDALTGQEPETKTFRGLVALNRFATTAFKKKRSRLGIPMADTLINRVLPSLQKQWKKAEDFIRIAGFDVDIQMLEATIIKDNIKEFIIDHWKKTKKNPTEEQKAAFTENLIQTWQREGISIPAKPLFEMRWGIRIDPVNEYDNKEEKNLIYDSIFNRLGQNPGYLNIPGFRQWCMNNGVQPFHLTPSQTEQFLATQQASPEPVVKEDKLMATLEK